MPRVIEALKSIIKKYKYTALVLLLGVGLMCWPVSEENERNVTTQTVVEESLEQKMQKTLSQIEGAGDVQVLLSLQESATHTYQEDIQLSAIADGTEKNAQTVILSNDGQEKPIEVKMSYPTYRGAVILCQGADKAVVKLQIVQAVSSLTGLSSDHIVVIKMKSN